MKILIRGNNELDKFIMGLPFIKGLTGVYPEAEIFMISKPHFSKMQEFAPYVHHFLEDQSLIEDIQFELVIDLQELSHNKSNEYLAFENIYCYEKFHYVDQLLSVLPIEHQRRALHLSETVKGFEEMKKFVMKEKTKNFDVVLYPFTHDSSKSWSHDDFNMFLMYFSKMNPGKKVLLLGLDSHEEELRKFKESAHFPKESLTIKTCSLDGVLSILKKSSFVITAQSPMKFLACNPETTLIEVNFKDAQFEQKCAYRNNSFVINFKKKVHNKFIYSSDELVFDNNPHFLSYVITSILDEDEEKLRWFAEKYKDLAGVYRTIIHPDLGCQLSPVYWGQKTIAGSLVKLAHKLQVLQKGGAKFAEDFYYDIHDNSELSQDQIIYDLSAIQREIEKLIKFFKSETHFTTAIKIENNSGEKLDDHILKIVVELELQDVLDERPSFVNEKIVEKLLVNLFFIRQVMNVSGQKLLENLPMTGVYYS